MLRYCLVWLICISLCACTSMRRVDPGQQTDWAGLTSDERRLTAGDQLRVSLKNNVVIELTISSVSALAIQGIDAKTDSTISLPLTDIATVERREKDSIKTTLLVVLLVVGAVLLIKVIAATHIVGSA